MDNVISDITMLWGNKTGWDWLEKGAYGDSSLINSCS